MTKTIRIGGASGFWGESPMAVPQFLREGDLDYIVFDYLAEITMSIMARQRERDPALGYARDFVSDVLRPHLVEIARQGVKIVSNAGGVNPAACGAAVRALVAELGLDLTVGVVLGDDILDALPPDAVEMFDGETLPARERIVSANAYLGAFPVARALAKGADIVITGRCVDSAVTLGACIHEFGWTADDLDALAGGSLCGHIIECGPQATGGNFTDWDRVPDLARIGYPIATIGESGDFDITKPAGTGGIVSLGTVAEQMVYEIGDPSAYYLPDVICDFTGVEIAEIGPDHVRISGAHGRGVPNTYKASVTYRDGWRAQGLYFMIGADARAKIDVFAKASFDRGRTRLAEMDLPDYTHTHVEIVGDDTHFGAFGAASGTRETAFKLAVRHPDRAACDVLLHEATGMALATPPGFAFFTGSRPKSQPVVRLFSTLVEKGVADISVDVGGAIDSVVDAPAKTVVEFIPAEPEPVDVTNPVRIPLRALAWGRSGDKGDKSNIGLIPRRPDYAPLIWQAVTVDAVRKRFAHFTEGDIERWYLPGTGAMNILMDRALGGGGMASLRNDSQGKAFAQVLLDMEIDVPRQIVGDLP